MPAAISRTGGCQTKDNTVSCRDDRAPLRGKGRSVSVPATAALDSDNLLALFVAAPGGACLYHVHQATRDQAPLGHVQGSEVPVGEGAGLDDGGKHPLGMQGEGADPCVRSQFVCRRLKLELWDQPALQPSAPRPSAEGACEEDEGHLVLHGPARDRSSAEHGDDSSLAQGVNANLTANSVLASHFDLNSAAQGTVAEILHVQA